MAFSISITKTILRGALVMSLINKRADMYKREDTAAIIRTQSDVIGVTARQLQREIRQGCDTSAAVEILAELIYQLSENQKLTIKHLNNDNKNG